MILQFDNTVWNTIVGRLLFDMLLLKLFDKLEDYLFLRQVLVFFHLNGNHGLVPVFYHVLGPGPVENLDNGRPSFSFMQDSFEEDQILSLIPA